MEVEIEMLNRSEVPENELREFHATHPLEVVGFLPGHYKQELSEENEEVLIQGYVRGETKFPEYYQTIEDDEEDDEEFEDEVYDPKKDALETKKTVRKGRKKSILDVGLQGLMGQANLSFAKGNPEIAEKICLEIIRQNPLAPEPFFTLADIYEYKDEEKYLNFLTIAAHLDPANRNNWIRIADMQVHKKNYAQARVFYSKAIRYIPKDYDIRLRKGILLEKHFSENTAMLTFMKMIPIIPADQVKVCLEYSKKVAEFYFNIKKFHYSLKAMNSAYTVVGPNFPSDHLNLYLDLLLMDKQYMNALNVLIERTNLEVNIENGLVTHCYIPGNYRNQFRIKLCVTIINLDCVHLIPYLVNNMIDFVPTTEVNWYMDVAEALMSKGKYEETIALCNPFFAQDSEPIAYVLLKYAECHRALGNIETAIESYFKVIIIAPNCMEARFTCSALLKTVGRHYEAIEALEQDLDGPNLNSRMLYERCLLLREVNQLTEYMELGYILLSRHSIKLRNREELIASSLAGGLYSNGAKAIVHGRKLMNEIANEVIGVSDQSSTINTKEETDLTIEEELNLFYDLLDVTYQEKKFATLQKICFTVMIAKRFNNHVGDLEKCMIIASYLNDDIEIAFNYFRDFMNKNPNSVKNWNFLALMLHKSESTIINKYVRRFIERHRVDPMVRMLIANRHHYCNSLKFSLNLYAPLQHEVIRARGAGDALIYLCMAASFQQLSIQKKVQARSTAFAHAIGFMNEYEKVRMSPATRVEVYYNYGRLYSQVMMNHMAVEYYKRALAVIDDNLRGNEQILGLQQEIAYNLHLIFKTNGNRDLALKYLMDYIVI